MGSLHDPNNWWYSLTEKQKFEIFKAYSERFNVDYTFSQEPTVYTKHYDPNELPIVPKYDNTTHSQVVPPAHDFLHEDATNYDEIRKQLASKVVWDQDRFPRPMAWDEDRFKQKGIK